MKKKKQSKKVFLSVLSAATILSTVALSSPSTGGASNFELDFKGVSQITEQKAVAKNGKIGEASFLADTENVKIPKGLQKKLEVVPKDNSLYIVQFDGPILEETRKELESTGATIVDYIPDYAYIVEYKGDVAKATNGIAHLESVEPYLPLYKVDPLLFTKGASALVKAVALDAKHNNKEMNFKGIDEVVEYATNNNVLYISPKPEYKVMNDVARGIVKADVAQSSYGLYGQGQTVAVADTGLDTGRNDSSMHEAFRGKITALYALGRTNNSDDPNGHGTHVAGSVLGNGTSNKGMAPQANLVFQSIMDSSGGLGGLPSNLSTLFSQAYTAGARIHTNSWGAAVNGAYTTDSRNVDDYVRKNDMAVLFAAGNEGPNSGTISAPGTAKNAITVGATENLRPSFGSYADNINHVAQFSSRGPTRDGRIKPDVMAPGTFILSARSSLAPDSSFWANHDSKYAYMGGTSMATPIVAGNVAQLREHFIKNRGITPKPSLLKAALIAGATDVGLGFPNGNQGWGRVTLDKSLNTAFVNETSSLSTSQKATYSFTATAGKPLKISLVWSDAPASTSASVTLVNDLDLVITAPNGTQYVGNDFTAPYNNNWDGRNNVENVFINAPQSGTYTVEVQAYNVPQGPQAFSLAIVN
ncbi:S8 family serine peptidase [Bacillus sp. RO1]|uniref:S8 family serine peptidase n=1 Tax=Bacillus sp. RO1 TaxID=2722703 RepID=UPI00145758F0|nr:S8 family serine peptidase [Bacillus sp. RO1]NLP51163.1 S8 family serine peptidase [Bacillus sp. RO1]